MAETSKEVVWMRRKKVGMTPEEFRALREKLNLSQEEMAHVLGVSFSTVSLWERGLRRITPLTAQGIRAVLAAYQAGGQND